VRLNPKQIEVVDDQVAAILRTKTPAERLKMAFDLWDMASRMITGYLKSQHPDWSQEQIQKETAHRLSHGAV